MSIWDRLPWKSRPRATAPCDDLAYKRMFAPDPAFFAVLLAGVFMDERFGLEEQELRRLVGALPEGLQTRGRVWINLYLSWALTKLIEEKYGREFANLSIAAVQQSAANVDRLETKETLNQLAAAFAHWFPVFDTCLSLRNEPDCPPEVKEASNHFLIAYALLKHGPDGPLFLADEDGAQKDISNALREALKTQWESFRRMVEIGAPLQEVK